MIVQAELSCLNCGYDVGLVEGRRGAPLTDLILLPTHQGDVLEIDGKGNGICPRCHGRLLPQGVTPVRRPLDRGSVFEGKIDGTITRGLMH